MGAEVRTFCIAPLCLFSSVRLVILNYLLKSSDYDVTEFLDHFSALEFTKLFRWAAEAHHKTNACPVNPRGSCGRARIGLAGQIPASTLFQCWMVRIVLFAHWVTGLLGCCVAVMFNHPSAWVADRY